ncbi:SgcJ/EcaC family oxidoreductase [Streptomyces sp. TRM 70351]|uniref:YybH family protein n=1 Tax=Streptomyces sp. TRM 70351 TaxID=3116552 RepID=UPI002E7AD00F|nr:SgcJ/EcaC family oxidoreductase [Streptomyces sp. TRM 70351]MEE1929762.1 SgcJ/EcaC family oxidoreductase [Streptomyces sp. TRM 70351]
MTEKLAGGTITPDVQAHFENYVRTLNSGDADGVNALYTEDAVAVWEPGKPLSGAARREYTANFVTTMKPHMKAKVHEAYVTGDTALLVVKWTMDTTDPEGNTESHEGVGLDVLARDASGEWRYAIDDPFGDAGHLRD